LSEELTTPHHKKQIVMKTYRGCILFRVVAGGRLVNTVMNLWIP